MGQERERVEHLITFQPMVGMVDSEHLVFVGRGANRVGEATEANEIERRRTASHLARKWDDAASKLPEDHQPQTVSTPSDLGMSPENDQRAWQDSNPRPAA